MGGVTIEAGKKIISLGRKNAMSEVLLLIAVLIILFLFYQYPRYGMGVLSR